MAEEKHAEVMDLPDDGFDWGAYFRAAERLSQEWLVFLNSHSEILHDNWLRIMMDASANEGFSAVGCTGSFGAVAFVQRFVPAILMEERRNGGVLKSIFWIGLLLVAGPMRWVLRAPSFPQFPNTHLRSNAFLTRRDLFAEFARNHRIPRRKTDAFRLEHGRVSYTRFLGARGLTSIIVGNDGKTYGPDAWMHSPTFRIPGQDNLLITDNQTRAYDTAPRATHHIMEYSAWGRFLTP